MCNERQTRVEVWVWSETYCEQLSGSGWDGYCWKKLETVTVTEDDIYTFDVTDWITPNESGAYKVMIKNIDWQEQERCLWVDYVGLEITYYEMGGARIWNSLYIDPHSIPKYSGFTATGEITCTGGDCGSVDTYLKYSDSEYGEYYSVPTSSSEIPMYTPYSNPYSCGEMEHLDVCEPSWIVTGTKAGEYYVKMVSASEGPGSDIYNETGPIMVSINPGVLYLGGSVDSNSINLTKNTFLRGTVDCGTAPCGDVKILAKYRKGNQGYFEVIGESGNLSTTNYNPQDCGGMEPDGNCQKSWNIYGNEPGEYQVMLTAYSNDEDVANKTYDGLDLRVNPEQTVGILSITNAVINPNSIYVSESATLSGTVSCSEENCGNVWVSASSGKEGLEIQGENPGFCGNMEQGSNCDVSWTVTGNKPDNYYIRLLAYSEYPEIDNKTSSVSLSVSSNTGQLDIIYFSFDQNEIYKDDTTALNASVTCSTDYCGRVTGLIEYNTSGLSTQNPNPQSCMPSYNYPCEFSWNVRGERVGSYSVSISVESNESGGEISKSDNLIVLDPENPQPVLYVDLGDLEGSYELGEAFTLRGFITCQEGDCGDVEVYSKYSYGDSWQDIGPATSLSTSEHNPKTISLNSGETGEVSWEVNSSIIENYRIGVLADALDPDVLDSQGVTYQTIQIFQGASIAIDIQSPERGKTLARGDEFLVKVIVKESGYPMVGAFVTASGSFFSAIQLGEVSDGIYSNTVRVGNAVSKGSYIITVFVKEGIHTHTQTTNIYVDPELEVSLDTDKNEYEILDKVILQGQVLGNGKPVKADLRLRLACPSRSFKEILLDTDSSGNYFYEYLISMATPPGVCTFELNTGDIEGNYNFTSRDVSIVPSEREVYRIDFLSPSPGSKYQKGDSVRIRTNVFYGDDPVGGAEVLCMSPVLEENIRLTDAGNGEYSVEYSVTKEAPSGLWVLTCIAKTPDEYFGRKSVGVHITPLELRLEKISPLQTNFQPGDSAGIRLKLAYPDNNPFGNATVYLKIGSRVIYLNETEPGVYEGYYVFKNQGVFTFDVHAEDPFGNEGLFPGEIVLTAGFAPFNFLWLVLPFVIAVLLLTGVVWKRGKKEIIIKKDIPTRPRDRRAELGNRIAELERKVRNVKKSKDVVEQEYYERKIDEKTFNRMIQNYEQEIISLNVEIEDLKRELARL